VNANFSIVVSICLRSGRCREILKLYASPLTAFVLVELADGHVQRRDIKKILPYLDKPAFGTCSAACVVNGGHKSDRKTPHHMAAFAGNEQGHNNGLPDGKASCQRNHDTLTIGLC
jgi:hypothetical protein